MKPIISVIIPTHNPHRDRLEKTLEALKIQTLANNAWELIVVDNNTPDDEYLASFDLAWHPQARLIREKRLGLTWARIAGIKSSLGKYVVFVDDDNVLEPSYLQHTVEILEDNPQLGSIGGKSLPEFETTPEPWVKEFWTCLALRDLGEKALIYSYTESATRCHPKFAPIGAGMALRKTAADYYFKSIGQDQERLALDRTGKSLQSGGDCDINLTILDNGWQIGYFPQLQLTHLMPSSRLTKNYLAKINYASSRSWIQVLNLHSIRPWKKIPSWSVWLRKIKAFFTYQAWKDSASYIRWQGVCGIFEGLVNLPNDNYAN